MLPDIINYIIDLADFDALRVLALTSKANLARCRARALKFVNSLGFFPNRAQHGIHGLTNRKLFSYGKELMAYRSGYWCIGDKEYYIVVAKRKNGNELWFAKSFKTSKIEINFELDKRLPPPPYYVNDIENLYEILVKFDIVKYIYKNISSCLKFDIKSGNIKVKFKYVGGKYHTKIKMPGDEFLIKHYYGADGPGQFTKQLILDSFGPEITQIIIGPLLRWPGSPGGPEIYIPPEIWAEIMNQADYWALSLLARVCHDFRAQATRILRARIGPFEKYSNMFYLPDGKHHGTVTISGKSLFSSSEPRLYEKYDLGRRLFSYNRIGCTFILHLPGKTLLVTNYNKKYQLSSFKLHEIEFCPANYILEDVPLFSHDRIGWFEGFLRNLDFSYFIGKNRPNEVNKVSIVHGPESIILKFVENKVIYKNPKGGKRIRTKNLWRNYKPVLVALERVTGPETLTALGLGGSH